MDLQRGCKAVVSIYKFLVLYFSARLVSGLRADAAGRIKHGLIYIAPKFTMVNTKVLLKLFYSQAQQQQ